jgi:hypothetical protein
VKLLGGCECRGHPWVDSARNDAAVRFDYGAAAMRLSRHTALPGSDNFDMNA